MTRAGSKCPGFLESRETPSGSWRRQPYIEVQKPIHATVEQTLIHLEVALKRGVWVEGRVRNRTDGRPVRATIEYFPLPDNPHLEAYPDATFRYKDIIFASSLREDSVPIIDSPIHTDAEGRFRAVALPGGGIIAVPCCWTQRSSRPSTPRAEPKTTHG